MMRSILRNRWTKAENGASIHQRYRMITAAMIAMLLLTSLANMVAAQAVPTVPGFEIEIVDLTVTCDTTVSFDAVVTNTAEIMNVEAILSFSLYDNQSAFDAGIGAIFVGDLITLSEGSNLFSRQLYADIPGAGSFVEISGTEELFVRVNSRLRGLAPTPEGGNFPITDVAFWTASVSGCLDVSPDDSDPSPTPTPTPTLVEQLVESLKRILSGILSR